MQIETIYGGIRSANHTDVESRVVPSFSRLRVGDAYPRLFSVLEYRSDRLKHVFGLAYR